VNRRVVHALRSAGVADYLVLVYLCGLNLAVLLAPEGPVRSMCLQQVVGLLVTFMISIVIVRGELLRHPFLNAMLYRIGIYGTVQLSYFFFKHLLPLVNPGSLDRELYALDLRLFGFEPAIWLDRFVGPLTTEWFAFFYFWYFFLLAAHIFPLIFGSRDARLVGEFMLGMLIVVCVGHLGYFLVPGFGPYKAMPEHFQNQLPPGLWMDLVWSTVNSNGAMKDIFPSLHTAGPCFVAMYSFRNRDRLPFRYTWPLITFFAANIIVATVFLRWHYVIDVFAGFTLATAAALLAPRITRWELERRDRLGLGPLCPLFGPEAPAKELPAARERAAA
jgi:membrane-associated phospholipid phosphatase